MNRIGVKSTNLVSVGYDFASHTLEVEFRKGQVYHYFEVPEYIYDGLLSATSAGVYFQVHIKGRFVYRIVQEEKTS